jgi:hypothetical protein
MHIRLPQRIKQQLLVYTSNCTCYQQYSPVQYAVVAGEAVRQLVVDNVRWHSIKVVTALEDVPREGPVLVRWDQRPLLFVQALTRRQCPVDAV